MENFEVRRATLEEIPLIEDLADRIWPETYKDIISFSQMAYMLNLFYGYDSLEKQFVHSQFIIGRLDDEPVAFASFGPSEEQEGIYKLHKLYLAPELQGKGLGRRLIDHTISSAKQEGAFALELNVNRQNPALGFYKRLGFEIVREEDNDIGEGYYMNDYVMRKEI